MWKLICGGWSGCRGYLRCEPAASHFYAFKRMSAVYVPCDMLFSSDFAATGPVNALKAADEFRWKGNVWGACWVGDRGVAKGAEMCCSDGDCEGGVDLLERG